MNGTWPEDPRHLVRAWCSMGFRDSMPGIDRFAGGAVASAGQVPTLVTTRRIVAIADQPDVDADRPALALLGEWIVDVGDLGDLRRGMPEAELVDFGDATIVPGFNDAHQRPTMTAANQRDVDVPAVSSRAALLDEPKVRARSTPPGQCALGTRYDHGMSTGGTPLSRADLDEVTAKPPSKGGSAPATSRISSCCPTIRWPSARKTRRAYTFTKPGSAGGRFWCDEEDRPMTLETTTRTAKPPTSNPASEQARDALA